MRVSWSSIGGRNSVQGNCASATRYLLKERFLSGCEPDPEVRPRSGGELRGDTSQQCITT